MKTIIIIAFCSILLASCGNNNQRPKEYIENRSRTFRLQTDSVIKRITEFADENPATTKVLGVANGLVFLEENLNEEQSLKYTDFDFNKMQARIVGCRERLLIYINHDSLETNVSIKSFITGTISYLRYFAKSTERVEKNISCASTGVRENEILNYIEGKHGI